MAEIGSDQPAPKGDTSWIASLEYTSDSDGAAPFRPGGKSIAKE
jgi:hypothetical protein